MSLSAPSALERAALATGADSCDVVEMEVDVRSATHPCTRRSAIERGAARLTRSPHPRAGARASVGSSLGPTISTARSSSFAVRATLRKETVDTLFSFPRARLGPSFAQASSVPSQAPTRVARLAAYHCSPTLSFPAPAPPARTQASTSESFSFQSLPLFCAGRLGFDPAIDGFAHDAEVLGHILKATGSVIVPRRSSPLHISPLHMWTGGPRNSAETYIRRLRPPRDK
jgi:hypothetical protein